MPGSRDLERLHALREHTLVVRLADQVDMGVLQAEVNDAKGRLARHHPLQSATDRPIRIEIAKPSDLRRDPDRDVLRMPTIDRSTAFVRSTGVCTCTTGMGSSPASYRASLNIVEVYGVLGVSAPTCSGCAQHRCNGCNRTRLPLRAAETSDWRGTMLAVCRPMSRFMLVSLFALLATTGCDSKITPEKAKKSDPAVAKLAPPPVVDARTPDAAADVTLQTGALDFELLQHAGSFTLRDAAYELTFSHKPEVTEAKQDASIWPN